MTISTRDQLLAAAKQRIRLIKTAAATTVATIPFSTFDLAGAPGAGSLAIGNITAGLVPTDADAGYPVINAFGGGNAGILSSVEFGNSVACRATLYDRVYHVGSVPLTALATTNFSSQPSFAARLPGTDYTNLEFFLEINVAVSATATTVAVGYTRDDGTAGRTTGATASLSGFTTRRLVLLNLQAGDKGLQKIESVTVGGTVASAGSVNVVVARRLWSNRMKAANDGGLDGPDKTGTPPVYETSALWLVIEADGTSSGVPEITATIANG